ncbi:hypothetical protein FA09DRAFT_332468 [Tilletiopsis washingtonensis]|uniref:Phospholipid/glycerol acyltransferase domain-containing protein n=1 Tax=Tilletiopsis washingtonensis TaxID=58919 RepID=A0A316Z0L0_9BASI|nr:hypothetical protein FA09DRAFT_332468 [Tilletiopsis washingtonensis]PWN95059.1 hypothetical protein FA09DRAFT_332468 [Tilletiopsis washingtonensis]
MEKFSRFRDAGTGIQVFLPPVTPAGNTSALHLLALPFLYVLGAARGVLLLAVVLLWTLLETLLGLFGARAAVRSVFVPVVLALLGFYGTTPETISLATRGRNAPAPSAPPRVGDLIVSNHSSYIDVLLLSRACPSYLLPVLSPSAPPPSAAAARGAARKRGPGAYMPETLREKVSGEARLVGWKAVGLVTALMQVARPPLEGDASDADVKPFDKALQEANAPCVVFPELVTSNNRALLRPAPIFPTTWRELYARTGALRDLPRSPRMYITAIKYEPPSPLSPSATTSVPRSLGASIWAGLIALPRGVSVRVLHPAEAPTGQAASADVRGAERGPQEAIADSWSALSRLRRTNLGFEEKEAFLAMYQRR